MCAQRVVRVGISHVDKGILSQTLQLPASMSAIGDISACPVRSDKAENLTSGYVCSDDQTHPKQLRCIDRSATIGAVDALGEFIDRHLAFEFAGRAKKLSPNAEDAILDATTQRLDSREPDPKGVAILGLTLQNISKSCPIGP